MNRESEESSASVGAPDPWSESKSETHKKHRVIVASRGVAIRKQLFIGDQEK